MPKKIDTPCIPFQLELSQDLPEVIGNQDYTKLRATFERIDELLRLSGIDKLAMQYAAFNVEQKKAGEASQHLSEKEQVRVQKTARLGLRCALARHLTGTAFRPFAAQLSDSPLLQWFCGIARFGHTINTPSNPKRAVFLCEPLRSLRPLR